MASRSPPPSELIAAARELGRAEAALEYARGEERCFSLKRLTPEQVIVAMFCKAMKIDMNRVTYEDHGLCVLIKEDGTGRYWRAFDGDPGRDCVAGERTVLADDYTSMRGGAYEMER